MTIFLVVPILIVVELKMILAESRLLDDIVVSEFVSILARPVIVIEATVTEVDVAITACTISLASSNMLWSKG